jgi:GntR family transcriptional regulator
VEESTRYREIAADLQRKIASGELPPGGKLPSDAKLGTDYGASRNTVREAVKLLLTRGLVERRLNQGTFVLARKDPFSTVINADTGFGGFAGAAYASEVIAKHRKPAVTQPRVEIQIASKQVGATLRLHEGAQVVIRHQQRFIDDELWSTQTTYYPMKLVQEGATRLLEVKDISEGVRTYLARELGIREVGSHDTMLVRAPNPDEATAFKIPDDGCIAVFETRQIGVDGSGKPLRLTISIYPADRNQFSMKTGALAEESSPHEA